MGYGNPDLDEYSEWRLMQELQRRRNARAAGECDYCGRAMYAAPICRFTFRHCPQPHLPDGDALLEISRQLPEESS